MATKKKPAKKNSPSKKVASLKLYNIGYSARLVDATMYQGQVVLLAKSPQEASAAADAWIRSNKMYNMSFPSGGGLTNLGFNKPVQMLEFYCYSDGTNRGFPRFWEIPPQFQNPLS
jgi:hypothetical protein